MPKDRWKGSVRMQDVDRAMDFPCFLRPWLWLSLIAAALFAAPSHICLAQSATAEAVPVVVSDVTRMELSRGQSFVGTVYPFRESDVGSAVDGRLVSLPIEDGQQLQKGDTLAELLRGLLEIERDGALAELDQRRQELAELEAGSRPEEIEQAIAEAEALQATLAYAESRLNRLEKLFERGTATTDELQDGQTELRRIKAQLRSKQAAQAMVEAGPRRETIAQAAAAVAVQDAVVQRIDDQLAKHTIRAPFDGWVVERYTEEGEWVTRGGLVARVAELDRVKVVVQLPELYVASLRPGTDVRLEFDAAPLQPWIGKVERIVPQADLRSRSFPVQVVLENRIVDDQPTLRGGMLARAWLPVGARGEVTVVPKDALVLGTGVPLVFVVDATGSANGIGTGTVRPVPVTLGATVAGSVEVSGEVEPGQLVVTRGNERLRPGAAVKFSGSQAP